VLTEEIMILKGMLALWILGRPYALGRLESEEWR